MTEFPDWLRGFVLVGQDGDDWRVVGVDESGFLAAIIKGQIAGGDLSSIAVDADGQMIMVPRGSSGNYMSVDASGFLTAILKGQIEGAGLESIAVDADGQLIMVPRGSSGNYMSIDSDGFMSTLMKGLYGATLKTMAVDDEGNMISILKDTEDQWGEKISVGMGELAARLGSPISWERRGQVVKFLTFVDGFSSWAQATGGAGSAVSLDASFWQYGGYSVKLLTDANVNAYAGITTYTDYPPDTRLGVEVVFSVTDKPRYLNVLMKIWDGTNEHRCYLRAHWGTSYIQIMRDTEVWVNVVAYDQPVVGQVFRSIKFVVDLDEGTYIRVLANGVETDVTTSQIYTTANAAAPYVSVQVKSEETVAAGGTVYIDRVNITTNEQ